MGVRYVNNANAQQDGRATFPNIQTAINNSSSGDTVVLEDNTTYIEAITLKDGVDIVCRNGVATVLSNNSSPCVIDNGVSVSCVLHNITFRSTSTGRSGTFTGGGTIICINTLFRAEGSAVWAILNSGCVFYGARAEQTTGGGIGFYNNFGVAFDCVSSSVDGTGFQNEGGRATNCKGVSTNGTGFSNTANGSAFSCQGLSDATGYPAFNNNGSKAYQCVGRNSQQCGFNNAGVSYTTTRAIAINCVGISDGALGGGASVGFNNGSSGSSAAVPELAIRCCGIATNASGGEGCNLYQTTVNQGVSGFSVALGGLEMYGAVCIDCNGFSQTNQGMLIWNAAVFGGADLGSKAINCSSYSDTKGAVQIGGNSNIVIGGSFVSMWNNATSWGASLSGNNTTSGPNTGTIIRNASFYCLHASALSLTAAFAATNVEFLGVIANRAKSANVVQSSAAAPDAQGNILG